MLTMSRSSRSASISSSTGWTTRQGPHQGAQKSTSTGPSASRTSDLKLASVTSLSLPVTGIALLGLRLGAQYFIKYSEVAKPFRAVLLTVHSVEEAPARSPRG